MVPLFFRYAAVAVSVLAGRVFARGETRPVPHPRRWHDSTLRSGGYRMRAQFNFLLSSKKIHLSSDETGVIEVRLSGVINGTDPFKFCPACCK
jgi:hypothetical protein